MNWNYVDLIILRNVSNMNDLNGLLSNQDIKNLIKDKQLYIIPFNKKNLTGLGYNLTPSDFIFSTQKGITQSIKEKNGERYTIIMPNDTVLILTKENIWLNDSLAGTIHSRVRIVSQGFGHISTTVDPEWSGPLLIALSNPTSRKMKFVLHKTCTNGLVDNTFCTILFHKMISSSTNKHDNPPQRIDILKEYVAKPPILIYLFLRKKYQQFKELVLGINEKLPPYYEWETPIINKLKLIEKEYEILYRNIVSENIYNLNHNIFIDDNLLEGELLSENTVENITSSIRYIKEHKEVDSYNLDSLKNECYNILYHIRLEIKTRQYIEYLSYLEKTIPKMQPFFLRIFDWIKSASPFVILVSITTITYLYNNNIINKLINNAVAIVTLCYMMYIIIKKK